MKITRYEGQGDPLNVESPNQYYINCEDGIIFNKNNKMLGYICDRYFNKVIYIKSEQGYNKHKPYYVNRLIYDHYTKTKNDYINNKIVHLDGDPSNCKIANLELCPIIKNKKKRMDIRLIINGDTTTYNNIQALLNDYPLLISRYKLNLLKNKGKQLINDNIYINYIKY